MSHVQTLAGFVADADPPQPLRDLVPLRILDIVGVSLAATILDTSAAVASYVTEQGGAPQASLIGTPARVPAANAALVNGVLAHSLDYDDTHLPSIIHPSAPVVPACLAAAERAGAPGAELVRVLTAALEVCVRLGMAGYDPAGRTSLYFERGQHATAMCGAVGGAAGAAALLGLDAAGIGHAMAIAASMASGILEANRTGGTVKRMHCGWAAHAAVTAAELASRGITGPPTVLEGRFGFFASFIGGRYDPDALVSGLGERWTVDGIVFKPYPANHFTHTTIDAVAALRRGGLRPEDVREVTVGIAGPTVRSVGEPIDVKRAPETGYQAQFSIPYVVAATLTGGGGLGLGLDDFADAAVADPARRELMAAVHVVADDDCTALYPDAFPAVVRVTTRDGRELVERKMTNRGGRDEPLTDDEVATKFADNAARAVGADRAAAIESAVKRVEAMTDVRELLAMTSEG